MTNIPEHRPVILMILDGLGYREDKEFNAISQADTPNLDRLMQKNPHCLLDASGLAVGLPEGQMGNSEVGHLNLGAGRVVYQDLTRITHSIKTQEFFENPVLCDTIDRAISNNKAVHVFGLLSSGGIHSHDTHIQALIQLAHRRGANKVYVHAFLDGRDTPPKSAKTYIDDLEKKMTELGTGKIASLVGRYYAMDRDKRWDRLQKAYDLLTLGRADYVASSANDGLEMAYAAGETDEFVKPVSIHGQGETPVTIQDGDSVIFMNFRADRAREITTALTNKSFNEFPREKVVTLDRYVCLTEYDQSFDLPIAFGPEQLTGILGEVISENGFKQLRIAETEKYAHVTFFINGGEETTYPGEDRILVPSPKVATYDLQPEMNAPELTDKLVAAIKSEKYDAIICNYANGDMVGHTGDFDAAVRAVECLDQCLGDVIEALASVDGEMLVTADHGNAEYMFNRDTNQAHTAHTSNLVPFIYVGSRSVQIDRPQGALCDVAPTVLKLLGLSIPKEMTGRSLLDF